MDRLVKRIDATRPRPAGSKGIHRHLSDADLPLPHREVAFDSGPAGAILQTQ
jgi:hypothetical protein